MTYIQLAGNTDVGQLREDNQDTFISELLTSPEWGSNHIALLAVIDGVGGYMGGATAADIAHRCITEYMAEPKGEIPSMLREALVYANNQIVEERKTELKLSRMACVLTITVVDAEKQKLYFVHVGDTRLYRYRNEILTKITQDHSVVGIREDAGELTEEEAMNHPRRNEILRDVGSEMHQINDVNFFDTGEDDFLPKDTLLLCSDGLTDMLNQGQITTVLSKNISLETKVSELIALANHQGGNDNITVVLAQNALQESGSVSLNPKTQDYTADTTDKTQSETQLIEEPARETLVSKHPTVRYVAWIIVGLLGIAAVIIGYFFFFSSNGQITKNPGTKPGEDRYHSGTGPKHQRPSLIELNDTLRLGSPFILGDTLWSHKAGKPLLVIPADTTKNNVAFHIKKNSKVQLENIQIQGFKVGMLVEQNVTISLREVRFINVRTRIQLDWSDKDTLTNLNIMFKPQADSVAKQSHY